MVRFLHFHTYIGAQLTDRNWDHWLPSSLTTLQKGKLNPALYVYTYSWAWRYSHPSQDVEVDAALRKTGGFPAPD